MAIVTFWSHSEKQTSQSSSAVISALQMGIDRNLKILLLDATFNSSTIKDAFEEKKKKSRFGFITKPEVGLTSGLESLIAAVGSNKVTPELLSSYTTPILSGRLDVLYGLKTMDKMVFENSLANIRQVIDIANQYYDLVFIDLEKGRLTESKRSILLMSDLVLYSMEQKIFQIEEFKTIWGVEEGLSKLRTYPFIGKEDKFSKFNCDNVARELNLKPGMCSIVYNTVIMEALQEGNMIGYMITLNQDKQSYRTNYFLRTVVDLNTFILEKIQELQYAKDRGQI